MSGLAGDFLLQSLAGIDEDSVRLDGKLHNAGDLASALGIPAGPDETILLEAYRRWGVACFARALGEFTCAIRDARAKRVVFARDRLGIRPFFYHCDKGRFLYGTSLRGVVEARGTLPVLDEETAARLLVLDWSDTERTLHQGILRLPPAHALVVTPESVKKVAYWKFSAGEPLRLRNDAEYRECFLERLEASLRCRMERGGKVGVFLSGGVDSTALAMLSERIDPVGLETFTARFDDPVADNPGPILEVLSLGKWERHLFYPVRDTREMDFDTAPELSEVFYSPDLYLFRPMFRKARERGIRTVFTGVGGDDVFGPPFAFFADYVRHLHFPALWEAATKEWDPEGGRLGRLRFAWTHAVKPLLPPGLVARARRFFPKHAPPWVCPEFARKHDVMNRGAEAHRRRVELRGEAWQQRLYHRLFLSGEYADNFERNAELAGAYGARVSLPLFDWRLIDYAFRVPLDQLYRNRFSKWILRDALAGIVPDTIRFQENLQNYTSTTAAVLSRQADRFGRWMASPLLESAGILDAKATLALWERRGEGRWQPELFSVLALEAWARSGRGVPSYGKEEKREETVAVTEGLHPAPAR